MEHCLHLCVGMKCLEEVSSDAHVFASCRVSAYDYLPLPKSCGQCNVSKSVGDCISSGAPASLNSSTFKPVSGCRRPASP